MSKYSCEKCKYYTNIKQHYYLHINTNKHKNCDENNKVFECEKCNKKFESNSGLWKHKKKCNKEETQTQPKKVKKNKQ